ncbi:helicase associated domain-containing protein [Streptomyces sp. NPDC001393]
MRNRSEPTEPVECARHPPPHRAQTGPALSRDLRHAVPGRTCPRRGDAAARQFYEREAHLLVLRKHVETIAGEDQEERELKLGSWIGNRRSRAATLAPERVEQLSAIGMRSS